MNTTLTFEPLLQHNLFRLLSELANGLEARLFLVGGAVRDYVLLEECALDLDFFVLDQPALMIAQLFASAVGGRYVLLDETNGIHRVVLRFQTPASPDSPDSNIAEPEGVITFDFSDALENSLERDLARRDLTINAMAVDVLTGEFHDPYQGLTDLQARKIRMISVENLVEDPLRMVRVFRLAAQLGNATIEPETLAAVTTHAALIHRVATERIHYEFLKMLNSNQSFGLLKQMGETGLLEELFPEFRAMRTVPPNEHHHLWLYDHTLELVNQVEQLFETIPAETKARIDLPFNAFASRLSLVKLACLLHDIGKPATMVQVQPEDENARPENTRTVTFYGHDVASEEMTETICQRWKLGNEMADFVKKLVRWHLYPCQFGPDSPRKSILRLFRKIGADTPDLLLLALADRYSTRGPAITPDHLEASFQQHVWLMEQYEAEQATLSLPPLLNGREVMALLEISPGPKVGEILETLKEAHQLGEVTDADQAKAWLLQTFGVS